MNVPLVQVIVQVTIQGLRFHNPMRIQGAFFISCALQNSPCLRELVQYKNPFQELISIGCASLRTYTRYHTSD